MYHIQVKYKSDRDKLAKYLRKKGIYTAFRYYPLHLVEFYGKKDEVLPNTKEVSDITLCLPLHQSLSDNDVNYITNSIKNFRS